MNPVIHRRAALGLAVQGPFNRNRRRTRRSLREFFPVLLVTGIAAALITFLSALFL